MIVELGSGILRAVSSLHEIYDSAFSSQFFHAGSPSFPYQRLIGISDSVIPSPKKYTPKFAGREFVGALDPRDCWRAGHHH
jgi:hypothetical protein